MELFYSDNCNNNQCVLAQEESMHCVKVLRHKVGDAINVIDGCGTLYHCVIESCSPKETVARIDSVESDWGAHNYKLRMAVAPPKNIERYEWFAEKATEIGIDEIYPIIGDYSQRKVLKTERLKRIVLSAAKQSLKGAVPKIAEPLSVRDFIIASKDFESDCEKIICYCDDVEDTSKYLISNLLKDKKNVVAMIGPEGDFSKEEAKFAIENGFKLASLGTSRLRIETAALTAVGVTYFLNQ